MLDTDVLLQVDDGQESSGLQAGDTKAALARRLIGNIRTQLDRLEYLLSVEPESVSMQELEALVQRPSDREGCSSFSSARSRYIDGVFNGEHMVGEDGEGYPVPPNYASKSKLVEGDLMRLIIADGGRFIFKQKGPIERERVLGMLIKDEQSDAWCVVAEGRKYAVLSAAISYHRGQPGDDAVVLIPKNTPSRWAAVENVIKRDISAFN
ncbi:MAG: hypothetical protein WCV84_06035 [Patescibacteria group bacterium]